MQKSLQDLVPPPVREQMIKGKNSPFMPVPGQPGVYNPRLADQLYKKVESKTVSPETPSESPVQKPK